MSERKVKTLIIDSLSGLLDKALTRYIRSKGKANYDKWTDWGTELLELTHIMTAEYGWEVTMIIGKEGSGKSVAARNLPPETTVYFNSDSKPLHFISDDGKLTSRGYTPENKNYFEVTSIEGLLNTLKLIHSKGHRPRVFLLGHVDTYRDQHDVMSQRLRVLGKMAHKHNIEGATNNCFYTEVRNTEADDLNRYVFLTRNSGSNTARSMMGLFPTYIPNDFQLINDILDGVKTKEDLPEGFNPE